MMFFFFKQKTAYEMRISDWSQTCALPISYRVPMAVATDCNPGTSPLLSPTLAMNMACTLFGLTPEEALAGMPVHAARALGLENEIGTVAPGKAADLCVWRLESPPDQHGRASCRERVGPYV